MAQRERLRIDGRTAAEIAASVRDLADVGDLAPGAALPPVRSLAADLGVNKNTVAAAYRNLVAAGVVESRGRNGTVVTGVPQFDRDGGLPASSRVDLASGNPDPRLFPSYAETLASLGYRPALYGTPAVLGELAEWARERMFGDDVPGGSLLVTHGAVDAVERLLTASLTRGDVVALEDPCFLSSIGTLRVNGFIAAPVAMDEQGMLPASLEATLAQGARAVVCTPRAHNPTGAGITAERAAELRSVLRRHPHVQVIEDDHFSAISAMPYERITPPETSHWALVRSVTKFLGPDLRVALVATDGATARRLEARLSAGTTWVSHLLQQVVLRTLEQPATASLLTAARAAYADRAGHLLAALDAAGLPSRARTDGLNVWIELGHGDGARTATALARRGWQVRPGAPFAIGDGHRNAIRVTTSTLTPDQAAGFAGDLAGAITETNP